MKGGMNGSILYELERPENTGLQKPVKVITITFKKWIRTSFIFHPFYFFKVLGKVYDKLDGPLKGCAFLVASCFLFSFRETTDSFSSSCGFTVDFQYLGQI